MNRPWLTIGLLIALFAAATLLLDAPPEVFEPPSAAEEVEGELQLIGYLSGVDTVQYAEDGAVEYQFTADRMSHFQRDVGEVSDEDYTTIDSPAFTFFPANSNPWYVRSESGRSIQEGEVLVLQDDVRVWQENVGREPTLITTSKLRIHPDSQVAETDQFVMITRPQVRTQGVGMHADLDQETFSIRSQGSTTYEPNPQAAE